MMTQTAPTHSTQITKIKSLALDLYWIMENNENGTMEDIIKEWEYCLNMYSVDTTQLIGFGLNSYVGVDEEAQSYETETYEDFLIWSGFDNEFNHEKFDKYAFVDHMVYFLTTINKVEL